MERLVRGVAGIIKDLLPRREETAAGQPPSQAPPQAGTPPLSAVQPTTPLVADSSQLPHLQPGSQLENRYVILRAYPLTFSNYYDVYDLSCGDCGRPNQPSPGGICGHCQNPLPRFLVRESAEPRGNLTEQQLIELSGGNSYIVPHRQVHWSENRTYVWLPPLVQWRNLAKVKVPAPLEQVVIWGQEVGGALGGLTGVDYYDLGPRGLEKIIVHNNSACLADLTSCRRPGADGQRGAYFFLSRVLYYLLTGRNLARQGNAADAPVPLRPVIERGMRGDYRTMDDMLEDLRGRRPKNDYGLSLKPASGKASHAGRVREINEDSLLAFEFTRVQESQGVPMGFYLVADGMGGHQAGEIASRTVQKIISERVLNAEVIPDLKFATRRLDETPSSILTSAIQEANRTLHAQARAKGSDMGTTLTAALIIGDTATIANVGDSRTYLLRGGTLRQVTTDHSLVASLLAAGVIQPAEVRQHPQRSQIYRTLGAKPEVEVDIFTETLQRGDRLLLCSDGLWEMVLDAEIAGVVGKLPSPQVACDELVQAANRAGGEDNVTVIVVKME
jgi:serine/threonine protein phosphatase PrpC